ncbi:unnamed protein product [Microthlaspi erraticum]|uniref:Uncharacterized protein n=1 Tax=Microthlaspi erraticum TaxID=1685480 RepID=A0A6D2IJ69_9BRAS|nr:unnamed protein product [Microthlaspi erraticum]
MSMQLECFTNRKKPSAMESKSASGVIRRRRKAPLFRYYPYASGSRSEKEKMKKEVVQLGIELSVCVAESMFLLCDDIRSMLLFCYKLWEENSEILLGGKLLRVMHCVYSKDIKLKQRVYDQDGVGKGSYQWEFIRTTWRDFTDGGIVLNELVDFIGSQDRSSFDDRLLSSAIKKYKQQVLKKLEDKLRSAKDVNGFARETIAPDASFLWKSLFDEEATPRGVETRAFRDLFQPLIDESRRPTWDMTSFRDMIQPIHSPYILGRDFAKEEMKEEVVQLGVELSLYVAQAMLVLCGDIRRVLRFCLKLWRDATRHQHRGKLVPERLLRVMHFVYLKYIKPKNGVFKYSGNKSVQWDLVRTTGTDFDHAAQYLDRLVSNLRVDGQLIILCREHTENTEEGLKKLGERLRCVKPVAEANGFARETMESSFLDLWKSVFDKEAKEATETLKAIEDGIFADLFLPILNQVAAAP